MDRNRRSARRRQQPARRLVNLTQIERVDNMVDLSRHYRLLGGIEALRTWFPEWTKHHLEDEGDVPVNYSSLMCVGLAALNLIERQYLRLGWYAVPEGYRDSLTDPAIALNFAFDEDADEDEAMMDIEDGFNQMALEESITHLPRHFSVETYGFPMNWDYGHHDRSLLESAIHLLLCGTRWQTFDRNGIILLSQNSYSQRSPAGLLFTGDSIEFPVWLGHEAEIDWDKLLREMDADPACPLKHLAFFIRHVARQTGNEFLDEAEEDYQEAMPAGFLIEVEEADDLFYYSQRQKNAANLRRMYERASETITTSKKAWKIIDYVRELGLSLLKSPEYQAQIEQEKSLVNVLFPQGEVYDYDTYTAPILEALAQAEAAATANTGSDPGSAAEHPG